MYEYVKGISPPEDTVRELVKQAECHLMWRDAFFRATGERPSNNLFLLSAVQSHQQTQITQSERDAGDQGIVIDSHQNSDKDQYPTSSAKKPKSKSKSRMGSSGAKNAKGV